MKNGHFQIPMGYVVVPLIVNVTIVPFHQVFKVLVIHSSIIGGDDEL